MNFIKRLVKEQLKNKLILFEEGLSAEISKWALNVFLVQQEFLI